MWIIVGYILYKAAKLLAAGSYTQIPGIRSAADVQDCFCNTGVCRGQIIE